MEIPNSERAKVLVQALPYIQKYAGKTVVVKYGGNAMIDEGLKNDVMNDIVLMQLVGINVVLVHGGGPEINAMLKKIQKESTFLNGMRVTDQETMDIVQQVLAGKVNKDLVQRLEDAGGKAVGLCGLDGSLLKADQLDTELGFVGEIREVNVDILRDAAANGYVPIVSTVAAGYHGEVFNINADVAAAKRYVFGTVGIDMIAGPSEILVICDGKTNPDWIAMDLFSQAEHDELAQAILLTDDAEFADKVAESIDRQIEGMSRKDIISASLNNRGAIIVTRSIEEACKVADTIAPEHLELSVQDADKYIDQIHHAGALFVGPYTCEALGDYCAGPNHVLPTSRTARYSSPLGVWDFQKRMSVLKVSKHGAEKLGRIADVLARGEFLTAHAASAMYRVHDLEKK